MTTATDTRLAELEARLARIEDEGAIANTLHRYCEGNIEGIVEQWADCFTPDGVLERYEADGSAVEPLRGREALTSFMAKRQAGLGGNQLHLLVGPIIDLRGDEASVVSYYATALGGPSESAHLRSFGRYDDEMVRCDDGRWRFKRRVIHTRGRHLGGEAAR